MSEQPRRFRSEDAVLSDERGQRPRLVAMLSHEWNRRLLDEQLAGRYDVRTPDPDETSFDDAVAGADLLILDAGAYGRHADRVVAYRQDETSLFRPVLLLVSGDDSRHAPDVWATVDDVVTMPVEKAVLAARIGGLLTRRALSRDLAVSEERFHTLFEMGPDPAMVVDDRGRLVDSNAAFRGLLAVSTTECHGLPLSELDGFDDDAVETLSALLSGDAVDTGSEADASRPVVAYRTGTGAVRYAECSCSAIHTTRDADGPDGATHRIVILRDITDRVHHEQELKRQLARLDEFAGVLAHEMRNPLGIATGWLEEARASGDPEAFDRVAAAHDRMCGMVDTLLQLARQGSVIGECSTIPIAPLVTGAWAVVETKDATLEVGVELSDRNVTCDPKRLREVFTNLFRNAVEHGGPDVTVRVGCTDDGESLFVADDGPGLQTSDEEEPFDPGYTTIAGGTGFGLAIVEQIAAAHGWTVRATNPPDGGARFEIVGMFATGSNPVPSTGVSSLANGIQPPGVDADEE